MASIIFLVLALVSVVTAQDFVNFKKDGKLCFDQVPSCKDMPRSMCSDKKEQMQMMCPKTCGFCTQERIKVELMDPETTTEIFLLYLKNDIKFLKEEISDVKYRVREIVKRQTSHFELIQEQRKKLEEVQNNDSGNNVPPFPPAQAPARAPVRSPVNPPPQAPSFVDPQITKSVERINAQMEMTQKRFSSEIQELRGYARTLSERIQGQHESIMQLARNMSSDIDDVKDKTQEKFHKIDHEILKLERELKKATAELETISSKPGSSGPTAESTGFADFKLESQRRQHQLQQSTAQAIGQLTNFTNRMAKQFMTSQQQFFGLLEQEREKTFNLEAMLSNLTYQINIERRQREEEKIERGDSNQKFEKRLHDMSKHIRENKHHIVEERHKLRDSVKLISGLKTNLTNVTGEIGNSRRYLAYQYQYIVRNIQQLMQKLVLVEKNSKDVINKTLDQLKKQGKNKGADQIFHLAKEMQEMEEKVERLQNQQVNLMRAVQSGASAKAVKIALPPPVSPQMERAMKEVKASVEEFRKTIAAGTKRTDDFEVMVNNSVNFTQTEIGDMKSAIMRMAELRNNESITQEDIRAKYQRGIFNLLGRQQSNKTRFFSPRFDFEGNRLSIHGYIAIYNEGEWGTVCDDNFDDREANVLCRMAGYRGGVYDQGKYKVGGGLIDGLRRAEHKIWVDELRCEGTEERIQDCRTGSDGWGIHDCDHGEDIGIKCYIS